MSALGSRDTHNAASQGLSTDSPHDQPVLSIGNLFTLLAVIAIIVLFASWAFQIPTRLKRWRSRSRRATLRPLMLPGAAELRRGKTSGSFTGLRSSVQRSWSPKEPARAVATEVGDCSAEKPEPSSRWSIETDNARLLPYPRTAYISPVKKRTAAQPIRFMWRKDGRPLFASKPTGKAGSGTAMGQTSPLFLYNPVTIQPYEKLKTLPFVSSE